MRKYGTTWAVFFLLLVLVVFVVSLTSISRKEDQLTYSQLQNLIRENKTDQILRVGVTNGESIIQVRMVGADRDRPVVVPSEAKEDLIKEFSKAGVTLDVKEPDKSSFWFSMISSFFLPILLLVGFLFFSEVPSLGATRL
jgi:cell division protease FtsH